MNISLKVTPTRRCENKCGMCFWSPQERRDDLIMGDDVLKTIIKEGKGVNALSLMTGEFDGYKGMLLFPALQAAAQYEYPLFKTITSGIQLTREDIDRMFEVFPNKINFTLSIDGPWGHDNYAVEDPSGKKTRHGDVIGRFIDGKHAYGDRMSVQVQWAHNRNAKSPAKQEEYDSILDAFKERCAYEGIPVTVLPMSDFKESGPVWGSKVNPWKDGLDSPRVDSETFNWCTIPSKYGSSLNVVQVSKAGVYKLCQCGVPYMTLGEVGKLGEAGIPGAVQRWYDEHPRLGGLFRQGGLVQVARELLKTEHADEVKKILDQDYPETCGACGICPKLEKYFPRLEK